MREKTLTVVVKFSPPDRLLLGAPLWRYLKFFLILEMLKLNCPVVTSVNRNVRSMLRTSNATESFDWLRHLCEVVGYVTNNEKKRRYKHTHTYILHTSFLYVVTSRTDERFRRTERGVDVIALSTTF